MKLAVNSHWKIIVGSRIRRLTPEKAGEILARIKEEDGKGATIFHKDIRDLTGGVNSQSINWYVIRKLAIHAA